MPEPDRTALVACIWRTHYFRGPRCLCGAFTMENGVLTENSLDPEWGPGAGEPPC